MKLKIIIKKIIAAALFTTLVFTTFACGKKQNVEEGLKSTQELFDLEDNINNRKVAVVYFSVDDDTKIVAEKFKEALGAELLEIVPKKVYSTEDLDFDNVNSRVYLEDEFNPFGEGTVLPDDEYETVEGLVVSTTSVADTNSEVLKKKSIDELPEIEKVDTKNNKIIVLGFPVWYENAPKVVYTFIKDLKNKVIVPFCTDGDIGMIDQYLSNFVDESVRVMSGKSFDKSVSVDEVKAWVTSLSADFDM